MTMGKRKQLNEPPFGEKLAPVLEELSKAVWEHKANFEGERPEYPDMAMMHAANIFCDILMDRMWEEQERKDIPYEQRGLQAETAGLAIYHMVKKFTGLDTRELTKKWMKDGLHQTKEG